ncbi:hypothetical protein GKE73_09690 [Paludibacterium sp. dN 18-1]|uniref:Uncharacterized protein n=2 Tax=Paludibacterium denitrificans TaxID=2675226 RepID=A0A844GA39_9NEIS|nr:hypothetical protein [Paludibacterium denitrificans]
MMFSGQYEAWIKSMEKPSIAEKVAGNFAAQAALTGFGATAAAVYAPVGVVMLPVLANALANGRYQQRIESEIRRIEQELHQHQDNIKNLTDAQFKFVNEALLTLTQTLEQEKLKYLTAAICKSVVDDKLRHDEASVLSRVIRDISADEIKFLYESFQYHAINFPVGEAQKGRMESERAANFPAEQWLSLEGNHHNRFILTGLLSLGLLIKTDTWVESYRFSPVVAKLLALLKVH